jgi:signal transduction histidine kinase
VRVPGRQSGRLDALIQAGLEVSARLALADLLQTSAEIACDLGGSSQVAVVLSGPGGELQSRVSACRGGDETTIEALSERLLAAVREQRRPVKISSPGEGEDAAAAPPGAEVLAVPIIVQEELLGCLCFYGKPGGFAADDEATAMTLAAQIGVAVLNAREYEDLRGSAQRLEALNDIDRAILEGWGTEEILRLVAHRARTLVSADIAAVVFPTSEPGVLAVRVADGVHADTLLGVTFPAEGSISQEVMRTGRPLVFSDVATDQRFARSVVSLGHLGPGLFVPLAVGDRVFGTLSLANLLGGRPLGYVDLLLVQRFATSAATALEQAEMRGELERLALMEDRERIAKELHDNIIQSLFAVGMALHATGSSTDDQELRRQLDEGVDEIDRVIRELRAYIFALQPGALGGWELERVLRSVVHLFESGAGIPIDLEVDSAAATQVAPQAREIVPAIREMVSNAVRHAGAHRISIRLAIENNSALVEVRDDGRGFEMQTARGRGQGLLNLERRARTVGGTSEIDSAPGRGTTVRIRIPSMSTWRSIESRDG